MALFVNTNVAGLNGQRNLQNVTDRMNSSFEKLSSGQRINSARDDSAGLQIADRLTVQLTGLQQGTRNANDGISIAQIAEGALSEITTNVQRMRQLAVQGGNRTLSADDRSALGQEFDKLLTTNNDIADRTAYGNIKLLDGSASTAGFQVQSGAQAGEQDTVTTGNAKLMALIGKAAIADDTGSLTLSAGGSLSTAIAAGSGGTIGKIVGAYMVATGTSAVSDALSEIFAGGRLTISGSGGQLSNLGATVTSLTINTSVLTQVLTNSIVDNGASSNLTSALAALGVSVDVGTLSGGWEGSQLNAVYGAMTDGLLELMTDFVTGIDSQRAKLGAEQNGLSSTIRSNSASIVNVSDSRARIMDTDFASETAELTRNQIIQQAATTILSQANQLPNAALSLLR